MQFERLLEIVGDEPVFDTGLLLAGDLAPADVRRQLSRWTRGGRLLRLRRGLYALAPPYQKVKRHPFMVANRLVVGSYVSLQSALAHHGVIPESVPLVTSVCSGRPRQWETPLGGFLFRHVKVDLLYGYQFMSLGGGGQAFVATVEKALLDLIHLTPGGASPEYLRELRLQSLEVLDEDRLKQLADRSGLAKLRRAACTIARMAARQKEEFRSS